MKQVFDESIELMKKANMYLQTGEKTEKDLCNFLKIRKSQVQGFITAFSYNYPVYECGSYRNKKYGILK